MVGDAERHEFAVGEDEACTALLRGATDAAPVRVTISPVKVVIDDQQRLFPLTLDEINVGDWKENENLKEIVS